MATAEPSTRSGTRAESIAVTVPGATVIDTEAVAGGGSLPGLTIPSVGVAIEPDDLSAALAALPRRSDRRPRRVGASDL